VITIKTKTFIRRITGAQIQELPEEFFEPKTTSQSTQAFEDIVRIFLTLDPEKRPKKLYRFSSEFRLLLIKRWSNAQAYLSQEAHHELWHRTVCERERQNEEAYLNFHGCNQGCCIDFK